MENSISKDTVAKWIKAWALSRELPLPVAYKSGYKVDVGFEKQKERYVFTEANQDFIQLSREIAAPWIFIKACVSQEDIASKIPDRWKIQPQGYMMFRFHPMAVSEIQLIDGYQLESENYNSTFVIRIVATNGVVASEGRVVIVDDFAIYDRIVTQDAHRRKGLASLLMKELEAIAQWQGVFKNFLVATGEGRLLYESLGWELYCPYTSIVITD